MKQVTQLLHMNKGNGETSYAKNSSIQSKILTMAKPARDDAIMGILATNLPGGSMDIADLGCSSGPTALSAFSGIADVVCAECRRLDRPIPELRLYLNDLPSSDFSSVFGSLPGFYEEQQKEDKKGQHCFVMGVPGSFYGRLFPTHSLHFVHSSSSLHWLSQIPEGLEKEDGKPANKGKLYISKTSPRSVVDAYSLQFRKDFSLFLKLRSEEMVPGGAMFLSLVGRRSTESPTDESCCHQWELLAQSLMAMASEGYVEEEKIDSFNAPYYAPSPEELRDEIEKEGSFLIKRLEDFEIDWDGGGGDDKNDDASSVQMLGRGKRVAKIIRAVTETMLEHHFGTYIMDDLFQRFGDMVGCHLSKTRATHINLVISLVKKC